VFVLLAASRLAHRLLDPDRIPNPLGRERDDARRIMMANTILGIFDDPVAARRAVEALRASPLRLDDISIVSRATDSGAAPSSAADVSAGEGATVGAVWGGLVGLAALLIPGVGPFIAVGALGAALTGALTGALVGGIAAALIDFGGIPEDDARAYEQQVHAGRTLVAIKAREEDAVEVRRILAASGAESIRDNQTDMTSSTNAPVHIGMYDGSGHRVSDEIEYGAPLNPTTRPRGIYDWPTIERSPTTIEPTIEGNPATNNSTRAAPVGQVPPRESGSDVIDSGRAGLATPEALGKTGEADQRQS
jgi:uncharacterized membrane protein